MKDIVSQFAMQLTLAEKRELVAELKGAIAEELASRASGVSVNIIFTIFTNVFSPIAPTRMPRIRQRGCAAFGA